MGLPGLSEMLVILAVVVLLFGANKLPKLGGAIGESIKNFKKGINDKDPKELTSSEKAAAHDQKNDKDL
ncbi:MAG: twin-arginine translocase TatA/TatE family subunit [Oligoflexales bacterium]|nr:twin-arginine translocase TatA/TatE family subunit [Oligoflexales bacterium]